MTVRIYVLIDPRDGAVRYVGQTKRTLARRFSSHLAASATCRTHRDCWIAGLLSAGLRPEIRQIDTCGPDWAECERKWIAHYRAAGAKLTNRTDGGEGTPGAPISEKNRRASSERQSQRMRDQRVRAEVSRKVSESWTEERRAQKAAEMARRMTPEARAQKSKMQRSPEMLERQRAAQAAYWTPERRAARAAQVKATMTPERIAAHAEKIRSTTASPEWRAAHAERERSKWTPEMRAAQAVRTKQQFAKT